MPAGLPQTPKRSLFDLREFDVRFSGGNRLPKTSSAHFLRKSAATKLFRPISSGNRPPQNFFGPFPQEIGRHKTFSAHFLRKSAATKLFRPISSGNRPPQNFFGSFPQEIARHKLFRPISIIRQSKSTRVPIKKYKNGACFSRPVFCIPFTPRKGAFSPLLIVYFTSWKVVE